MARRSIGFSLALGIVLLVLVILLGVGWQVLVWKPELGSSSGPSSWWAS